jgi:hypothetical protein
VVTIFALRDGGHVEVAPGAQRVGPKLGTLGAGFMRQIDSGLSLVLGL